MSAFSNFSGENYFQKPVNGSGGKVSSRFRTRNKSSRPVPVKSKNEPKIDPSDDGWDARNQAAMAQLESSWTGDWQTLYEKFQEIRDRERAEMEKRGLVDKQDAQKSLDDAIIFVGTCMDMCPVFERVRRAFENSVLAFEKDSNGKIDPRLAVKAFSRPAAGQPPPLPSDVRPPGILQTTLTYLINTAVQQLPESHSFLWDRTRSIRQDFTYQNYSGYEAVDCNERIARIHIVSLHVLAGSDVEYSRQQELEQFNKALQTLQEFYSDARRKGAQCPNEAEFQAYRLLSHIRDADLDRQIQSLPRRIFLDSRVQLAIELRNLVQQNNITERGYTNIENAQNLFVRFFKFMATSTVPYLFACLLEVHFNDIRMWALKAMASGYHKRGKPYLASHLVKFLGCDDEAELLALCEHWELTTHIEDNVYSVDVTSWNDQKALSKPPPRQAYSQSIVEPKRNGRPLQDFIQGNNLDIYPQNSSDRTLSIQSLFPINSSDRLQRPSQSAERIKSTNSASNDSVFPSFPVRSSVPASRQSTAAITPSSVSKPSTLPSFAALTPQISQPRMVPSFTSSSTNGTNTAFSFESSSRLVSPPRPKSASVESVGLPTTKSQGVTTSNSTNSVNLVDESILAAKERAKIEKKEALNAAIVEEQKQIIHEIVMSSVKAIGRKTIEAEEKRRSRERERLIVELSTELFQSLVYDNTWQACQEARANEFRRLKILRRIIDRIKVVALASKANVDLKKKRHEQYLHATSMMGRPLKRQKFSPRRISGQSMSEEGRIKAVAKERDVTRKLWAPIDLKSNFLPYVQSTFENFGLLDGILDVNLFTSDWHAPAGVWLRRKLGLEWNGTTFSHTIESKFMTLTFSTMINDPDSYENVGALIFQCGMTDSDNCADIEQKLRFDREALYDALRRLRKYSSFGISLMILYWPFEGISNKQVAEKLNLAYYYDHRSQFLSSMFLISIDSVADTDISAGLEMLAKSIKL